MMIKEYDQIIREIELEQYKVKNFLKVINSLQKVSIMNDGGEMVVEIIK